MIDKYTPGPWRVGDAGHTVFGPKTDNPSPEVIAPNLSRANAHLIVRAVNNHAKLLEALVRVLDAAVTGTIPDDWDYIEMQARAAIKQAKG